MSLYVLSAKPSFVDTVKAALKTDQIKSFATTSDLLNELLDSNRAKSELIIIELSTVSDASRLIDFVKASGPLQHVPILAVGTEEELQTVEAGGPLLDATVRAPCQAVDLAAVTARLREQRDNEA